MATAKKAAAPESEAAPEAAAAAAPEESVSQPAVEETTAVTSEFVAPAEPEVAEKPKKARKPRKGEKAFTVEQTSPFGRPGDVVALDPEDTRVARYVEVGLLTETDQDPTAEYDRAADESAAIVTSNDA